MKQTLKRWTGIGLMAASVLTVGGTLTLQSDAQLAFSIPLSRSYMADGGGDRPAPPPCPPKQCLSEDATV